MKKHSKQNVQGCCQETQTSVTVNKRNSKGKMTILAVVCAVLMIAVVVIGVVRLMSEKNEEETALSTTESTFDRNEGNAKDTKTGQIQNSFQGSYEKLLAAAEETANYCIYDLNQDQIPELFLQKNGSWEVYTFRENSAQMLGTIPGAPYVLCPLDGEPGILAVMQFQLLETVKVYRIENGAWQEEVLLLESLVSRNEQIDEIPRTPAGYRDYSELKQYPVYDSTGLDGQNAPKTRNGEIFAWITEHKEELNEANRMKTFAQSGRYVNEGVGIYCAYPDAFETSVISDNPAFLFRCENIEKREEMEVYCQELEQSLTGQQALEACVSEYSDMEVTYCDNVKNWYTVSLKTEGCYLYRKAFLREEGKLLVWFDYYVWQDTMKKSTSENIAFVEENFSVKE